MLGFSAQNCDVYWRVHDSPLCDRGRQFWFTAGLRACGAVVL